MDWPACRAQAPRWQCRSAFRRRNRSGAESACRNAHPARTPATARRRSETARTRRPRRRSFACGSSTAPALRAPGAATQHAGLASLRVISPPLRVLLFPFTTVARPDADFLHRSRVEAARVHAETIRMRTRHVERFDAANRTEQVLGRVRVEAVRCQNIAARKQLEAIGGNHQVQVARLAAHGAVAVGNLELGRCHHFESDATAMTTAGVCNHESPCSLRPMPPSLMPFM